MFRTVPVHFSDRSCHIRRTSFVRVVTDQIIRKETGLRLKTTGHWTATVLVAFPLLSGGAARSVGQKKTPEIIMRVGYPASLLPYFGFWKVLGGIALLASRF